MFSSIPSSTSQKSSNGLAQRPSAADNVSFFGKHSNIGGFSSPVTDSKSGQKSPSGNCSSFGAKPLELIESPQPQSAKAFTSSSIDSKAFAAPLTGTLSAPTESSTGKALTSSFGVATTFGAPLTGTILAPMDSSTDKASTSSIAVAATFGAQQTDSKSIFTNFSSGNASTVTVFGAKPTTSFFASTGSSTFLGHASTKSLDTSPALGGYQSGSKLFNDSSCDQLTSAGKNAASKFTQTDPLFGQELLKVSAAPVFGVKNSARTDTSTKPISLELPTVFKFGFSDSSNNLTSSSTTSSQPMLGAQKVTPLFSGINAASIFDKPTEVTKAPVAPFNTNLTAAINVAPTFESKPASMKFGFTESSANHTPTSATPSFGAVPMGFQFALMDSSPYQTPTTAFGAAQKVVSPTPTLSKFTNRYKYRYTIGSEFIGSSVQSRGSSYNINTRTHCITAMNEFMNKSLEELRLEYLEHQSDQKRLHELLEGINVENKKPSVLLEVMRKLAGGKIEEEKLKTFWLKKISPAIGDILSVSCDDLQRLGLMADIIKDKLECSCAKKADLAAPISDSNMRLDHVESVMSEMMKQMESLSTASSQQGKSETNLTSAKQSRYQKYNRAGIKMRKATGKLSQKSEK